MTLSSSAELRVNWDTCANVKSAVFALSNECCSYFFWLVSMGNLHFKLSVEEKNLILKPLPPANSMDYYFVVISFELFPLLRI